MPHDITRSISTSSIILLTACCSFLNLSNCTTSKRHLLATYHQYLWRTSCDCDEANVRQSRYTDFQHDWQRKCQSRKKKKKEKMYIYIDACTPFACWSLLSSPVPIDIVLTLSPPRRDPHQLLIWSKNDRGTIDLRCLSAFFLIVEFVLIVICFALTRRIYAHVGTLSFAVLVGKNGGAGYRRCVKFHKF